MDAAVPAPEDPGQDDFRWGFYSFNHLMTLAAMKRQYLRIGLDVIDYQIMELID